MNCEHCGNELGLSSQQKKYCNNSCKQKAAHNRKTDSLYDASCIEIKKYSVDIWASAVSLSVEYGVCPKSVQRGLESCKLARVDYSYYINRYLKKDGTPMNKDVDAISRELQRDSRDKKWVSNPTTSIM